MIQVYLYGMSCHQIRFEDKCSKMLNYFCRGKDASVHIEYQMDADSEDDGGCYSDDDGSIYIDACCPIALAHELVHAVQLINGQLDLKNLTWKGKNYKHSKIAPWEQQAYGTERKILEAWLQ
jgi:hypothetical protein